MASPRKYTLDTNLFIEAFRDSAANAKLTRFHSAFAPFEYPPSVVAQELRAGVRPGRSLRLLERQVLYPFCLRCPLETISTDAAALSLVNRWTSNRCLSEDTGKC